MVMNILSNNLKDRYFMDHYMTKDIHNKNLVFHNTVKEL